MPKPSQIPSAVMTAASYIPHNHTDTITKTVWVDVASKTTMTLTQTETKTMTTVSVSPSPYRVEIPVQVPSFHVDAAAVAVAFLITFLLATAVILSLRYAFGKCSETKTVRKDCGDFRDRQTAMENRVSESSNANVDEHKGMQKQIAQTATKLASLTTTVQTDRQTHEERFVRIEYQQKAKSQHSERKNLTRRTKIEKAARTSIASKTVHHTVLIARAQCDEIDEALQGRTFTSPLVVCPAENRVHDILVDDARQYLVRNASQTDPSLPCFKAKIVLMKLAKFRHIVTEHDESMPMLDEFLTRLENLKDDVFSARRQIEGARALCRNCRAKPVLRHVEALKSSDVDKAKPKTPNTASAIPPVSTVPPKPPVVSTAASKPRSRPFKPDETSNNVSSTVNNTSSTVKKTTVAPLQATKGPQQPVKNRAASSKETTPVYLSFDSKNPSRFKTSPYELVSTAASTKTKLEHKKEPLNAAGGPLDKENAKPVKAPAVEPEMEPWLKTAVEPVVASKDKPADDPIIASTDKPAVVEPPAKSIKESIKPPAAKPAAKPASAPMSEPVSDPTVKPAATTAAEPPKASVAKPVPAPEVKPTVKPTAAPAKTPAAKPVSTQALGSVDASTVNLVRKDAAEAANAPVTQPVSAPVSAPVSPPVSPPVSRPVAKSADVADKLSATKPVTLAVPEATKVLSPPAALVHQDSDSDKEIITDGPNPVASILSPALPLLSQSVTEKKVTFGHGETFVYDKNEQPTQNVEPQRTALPLVNDAAPLVGPQGHCTSQEQEPVPTQQLSSTDKLKEAKEDADSCCSEINFFFEDGEKFLRVRNNDLEIQLGRPDAMPKCPNADPDHSAYLEQITSQFFRFHQEYQTGLEVFERNSFEARSPEEQINCCHGLKRFYDEGLKGFIDQFRQTSAECPAQCDLRSYDSCLDGIAEALDVHKSGMRCATGLHDQMWENLDFARWNFLEDYVTNGMQGMQDEVQSDPTAWHDVSRNIRKRRDMLTQFKAILQNLFENCLKVCGSQHQDSGMTNAENPDASSVSSGSGPSEFVPTGLVMTKEEGNNTLQPSSHGGHSRNNSAMDMDAEVRVPDDNVDMVDVAPARQDTQPPVFNAPPVFQNTQPSIAQFPPVTQNDQPAVMQFPPVLQNFQPAAAQFAPVLQNSQPAVMQFPPVDQNPQPSVTYRSFDNPQKVPVFNKPGHMPTTPASLSSTFPEVPRTISHEANMCDAPPVLTPAPSQSPLRTDNVQQPPITTFNHEGILDYRFHDHEEASETPLLGDPARMAGSAPSSGAPAATQVQNDSQNHGLVSANHVGSVGLQSAPPTHTFTREPTPQIVASAQGSFQHQGLQSAGYVSKVGLQKPSSSTQGSFQHQGLQSAGYVSKVGLQKPSSKPSPLGSNEMGKSMWASSGPESRAPKRNINSTSDQDEMQLPQSGSIPGLSLSPSNESRIAKPSVPHTDPVTGERRKARGKRIGDHCPSAIYENDINAIFTRMNAKKPLASRMLQSQPHLQDALVNACRYINWFKRGVLDRLKMTSQVTTSNMKVISVAPQNRGEVAKSNHDLGVELANYQIKRRMVQMHNAWDNLDQDKFGPTKGKFVERFLRAYSDVLDENPEKLDEDNEQRLVELLTDDPNANPSIFLKPAEQNWEHVPQPQYPTREQIEEVLAAPVYGGDDLDGIDPRLIPTENDTDIEDDMDVEDDAGWGPEDGPNASELSEVVKRQKTLGEPFKPDGTTGGTTNTGGTQLDHLEQQQRRQLGDGLDDSRPSNPGPPPGSPPPPEADPGRTD